VKRFINVILAIVAFVVIFSLIVFGLFRDNNKDISFSYPFENALFPPEFPSPVFRWKSQEPGDTLWRVELRAAHGNFLIVDTVSGNSYKPTPDKWNLFKNAAGHERASASLELVTTGNKGRKRASVRFRISGDSVGAPIMYREIPLPFAFAEANPDSMCYRLIDIGSEHEPHTIMKKFMVCGNCHSSSADGRILGLDFDAAHRDKGGYFIAEVKDTIVYDTGNYLSWNKIQDVPTFGMFSKISPNGRYVATTIKDRVLHHSFGYDVSQMAFSQIFFPVNGVLAIYDRYTETLKELPGANMPEYVQSNAFWTPDGENIVFVRAKALPREEGKWDMLLSDQKTIDDFVNRKNDFKFDICIIPFNNGKGGIAKPVEGASANGKSNYFPAISPDGKWLIFCQAVNYMLLMPDSRLYIVSLEGGKAKKLECNLPLMNSWHAWSPNGKWIVFASKGLSIYTDMFISHIDNKGRASVPVLLENARKPRRVANYMEFMNIPPDRIFSMIYKYVDIAHIRMAQVKGDTALARKLYDQFILQDQYSLASEYLFLSRFNLERKNYSEARRFINLAYSKYPGDDEISALYKMLNGGVKN